MATTINLLTKRFVESDLKKVKAVKEVQVVSLIYYAQQMVQYLVAPSIYFKEVKYVNNSQGVYY